jgi:hypothetical protein
LRALYRRRCKMIMILREAATGTAQSPQSRSF